MKKLLLVSFLSVFSLVACVAQPSTTFNKFKGSRITGLSVGGGWDVTVREGSSTGVTITMPEKYKDYFTFELKDGVFQISSSDLMRNEQKRRNWSFRYEDNYRVEIVCNSMENINLSGGVDLMLNGNFSSNSFRLSTSGGSDVKTSGTINCNNASLSHSGGADVSVTLNAKVDVNLSTSGGADVRYNLKTNTARISVSGGADLDLRGSAEEIRYQVSGGADIDAEEFVGNTVYISASGGADIKVNAKEYLKINKSGGASIGYKGNPRVDMENSGIRKLD